MSATNDLETLLRELREDVVYFLPPNFDRASGPKQMKQTQRRAFVKSVFSSIEAMIFQLKSLALKADSNGLSTEEIAVCKEQDYDLTDNGQIKQKNAKLRFLPNIKFSFRIVAQVLKTPYELNASCAEWEALRRSIGVRDRLMHPKSAGELSVQDDEVIDAWLAYDWVWDQIGMIILPAMSRAFKEIKTR